MTLPRLTRDERLAAAMYREPFAAICRALLTHHIPFAVEDTGGLVMAAVVRLPNGKIAVLQESDEGEPDEPTVQTVITTRDAWDGDGIDTAEVHQDAHAQAAASRIHTILPRYHPV